MSAPRKHVVRLSAKQSWLLDRTRTGSAPARKLAHARLAQQCLDRQIESAELLSTEVNAGASNATPSRPGFCGALPRPTHEPSYDI
jgi:hypothetical protein